MFYHWFKCTFQNEDWRNNSSKLSMTKQKQFASDQMIRTKKNQNQFLPKVIKYKWKPNGGFRETTRQSRLGVGQLEVGWGNFCAKIGANVGVEEAQVLCNTDIGWVQVRCNTLSRTLGKRWSRDRGFRHKHCKIASIKSLPRFVLGWVKQKRSIKEVIKHNGQRNHQRNTPLPSGVAICYTIFTIVDNTFSPRFGG